jgi:hypothetical protein
MYEEKEYLLDLIAKARNTLNSIDVSKWEA